MRTFSFGLRPNQARPAWVMRLGVLFTSFGVLVALPGKVQAERSPAVFPPQRIELRFFHAKHLATGALTCQSCHAAEKSSHASDRMIPDHKVCGRCHLVEAGPSVGVVAEDTVEDPSLAFYGAPAALPPPAPMNDCSLCHPRTKRGLPPLELSLPAPNLKFSHKLHLSRGVACSRCHSQVSGRDLATREDLPDMQTCLGCHQGRSAKSSCDTCHLTQAGGLLRTQFPTGSLRPERNLPGLRHDPAFRLDHKGAARSASPSCKTCHAETFCVDCHNGSLKVFGIHPADWLAIHPVAARKQLLGCQGCHRAQSFCATCHERIGIGADAPTGRVRGADPADNPTFRSATSNLRVHPEGWADLDPVDRSRHHATYARRQIQTCISCHREETCLGCHATLDQGGVGVNPHPASMALRCRSLLRATPRACVKCHQDTESLCL